MVEELRQGDAAPGPREVRQPFRDRVTEGEHLVLDERQGHRATEGLGHAGHPHLIIESRRLSSPDDSRPGGEQVHLWAALDDDRNAG